jgi:1,5-anhydro-D-fructose reductase (1,5-anhydro-D-mannitol-forming)
MVINWGIIGFGAIAEKCTAPAMLEAPHSSLVSLMCRSMDKARACAQKFAVPKYWDDADKILSDAAVDAVYVSTPVSLHRRYTVDAAEAGKHVLVEKPMAVSASECEEMIAACQANKVKLMVCFYQRFNARHQRMKELLAGGVLGKLCAARIQFSQFNPYVPGAWRYDPKEGGGTVMDTGSHCIDTLRFLLGQEITDVRAITDNLMFRGPVEDTASAILRFGDGVQAVLTSYFSSPAPDQSAANAVEVYGEKGVMIASPLNDKFSRGELRWHAGEGWQTFQAEQSTHVALLEAFTHCIEHDTPPPVAGADGLVNLRVIEAIYRSSVQGCRVRVVG